jgi:hypothetical protein
MEISLKDLVDGTVVEANKERVIIMKDGKRYLIEFGSSVVKKIDKHH